MKILKKLLIATAFFLPLITSGQEVITGVTSNPEVKKASLKSRPAKPASALKLPFFDDFSNYTGLPDNQLWADEQGYVNTGFAVYPPSIGVVTLDALDADGKVYAHASNSTFGADTLTSLPIRLDSNFLYNRKMTIADSIYFSFCYQPAGGSRSLPANNWDRIGDAPEHSDKIVLEFGYSTGNIVFAGFIYGEYIADQSHHIGDSIENPFFPGTYYVFESDVYPGEAIMIPADSIFAEEYVWNEVWSSDGCSIDSWLSENPLQYFKQVIIPITDEQYLRNNFQFRFRNYASLDIDSWNGNSILGWSSNCDQWNLDYIKLNLNRTYNDIYPNDVAFVSPSSSALKEYTAMPWKQFRPTDMAEKFHNELSNLSNSTKNTYYNYFVTKNHQQTIYTSPSNNENAEPYSSSGLHTYQYHAEPNIGMAFEHDGADSAVFTITHAFGMVGINDDCRSNDTCVFEQKFYNYYAYDDGTAEAGYCLLSTATNPQSYFAVKFSLAEPDSLQAVRMWFNRTLNDENIDYFTLMVWADDNGMPGEVLYELPSQLPGYAHEFNDFVTYYPEEPIAISGDFYVGFHQSHNVQLNIGFDQNNDARGKFFYKTTTQWNQSFYRGAPMIRPVVGKSFDHSGVQNHSQDQCRVYPNPTDGSVHIDSDLQNLRVEVFNTFGQLLEINELSGNDMSLQQYPSGFYLLKIYSDGKFIKTEKIIKR